MRLQCVLSMSRKACTEIADVLRLAGSVEFGEEPVTSSRRLLAWRASVLALISIRSDRKVVIFARANWRKGRRKCADVWITSLQLMTSSEPGIVFDR